MNRLLVIFAILLLPAVAFPATLRMGPGRTYATIQSAINAAASGDTIEVDAGTYTNQGAEITKSITLVGVGGKAHFRAASSDGPVFWISNGNSRPWKNITVTLRDIEISRSTISTPYDKAIYSYPGVSLTIDNCYIHDTSEGLLMSPDTNLLLDGGTPTTTVIRNSEFYNNGMDTLPAVHGMYISQIGSFTLEYSYIHGNLFGHNVKSRAKQNYIRYNRIMDETTGNAISMIDIPNGGETYIVGNLLHKSNNASNQWVILYNEEGIANPPFHPSQALYVVNNTVVNEETTNPIFVWQRYGQATTGVPTTTLLQNNIFIGPGTIFSGSGTATQTTDLAQSGDPGFVNMSTYDYRLTSNATGAINAGTLPGTANGVSLAPAYQYVHPLSYSSRPSVGTIDIGAYEYTQDTIRPKAPTLLRVQ